MGFLRKTFKKIGKGIKSLTKKFAKFMSSDIGKFISLAAMVMMTGGAFGVDMFGKKAADSAGQKIAEETVKEEIVKEGAEKVASESVKKQIATSVNKELAVGSARDMVSKDMLAEFALDKSTEATLNTIANSNVMSNNITQTLSTASTNPVFQANANTVVEGGKVALENSFTTTELDVVGNYMKRAGEGITDDQIQQIADQVTSTFAEANQPKGLFGGLKKGV
jgi:5'-3' exonuclease